VTRIAERPPRRDRRVELLVIDDSAVVREVLQRLLSEHGALSVTTAADPIIAMQKMQRVRPDVILLDLVMPRMDGLSFLRKLMAEDPIPVVVCAARSGATDTVFRALEEGAVDVVIKPQVGVRDFLEESVAVLVGALLGAAKATVAPRIHRRGAAGSLTADLVLRHHGPKPGGQHSEAIVAVGASTGGTEALGAVLSALPHDAPGLAVVQHMPEGFTAAFAARLDRICRIEVKEARTGDRLCTGRALIAPGNRHMVVFRAGGEYVVEVTGGPLVSLHRPSVDVLFRSVAEAAGANAVGVLLTGMGDDGASGLLEMQQRGAPTIAQDEATSIVFGMPKAAISRGAADDVVPLPRIAAVLLNRVSRRFRATRAY
jgi:two-component system, chemotaxis family, protein-glutamate methylesterase/glutaminase